MIMANNVHVKQNGKKKPWEIARDKFENHNFMTQNSGHESIEVIKEFMKYHVKDITTSQLRNVYNVILDSQLGNASKRVKIAYIAARNNNYKVQVLFEQLDKLLAENGDTFETIRNFTEACVAYHKYYDTLKK